MYDSDTEAISSNRAQETFNAYPDLNFTYAREENPNWAPTPVKVVGPEPEPRELYFHKQQKEEPPDMQETMKKEPFSATSTPRKKPFSVKGEELYSTISPRVQS